ncbi:hypothetical protein [Clostridium beijerinckii]|uniref:DUF2178 domain-containing protein n=1 Tax=Clostridium beijerinckii TaxID=1520 RepID=A0A1S8SKJ2_CLOBE|nr:hypothetical protein [Clostridium beijerinckii]NRY63807.1 hypothetical protein [Clostridium beijerinckii]OOM66063.1 hypothetical protein CLBCK_00190 [Clostridium beijerinckii]
MKKEINLRTKELLESGVFGIVWIAMGLLNLFQLNFILKAIVGLILLIASISFLIPYFIKSEKEDEMSILNQRKAKSRLCDLLILGISVFTLISVYKDSWVVDLKFIMPFIIGGVNLIKYIFFVVGERFGV